MKVIRAEYTGFYNCLFWRDGERGFFAVNFFFEIRQRICLYDANNFKDKTFFA